MESSDTSSRPRSPLRLALKIALWIAATILLAVALAAAWAWSNRYELIERQAITYFDSLGIEADLSIRSATRSNADIRNIRLAHDGETFLKVKRLQAAYQWGDLLNGKVERLDFDGLEASITVDESGQIVDGWMPPSTGGGTGLPSRGIGLSDATLTLSTPYGDVPMRGDAEIGSLESFTVEGEVGSTELSRDDLSLSLSGPIRATREAGGAIELSLPETPLSLTHSAGRLEDTILSVDGRFDPETGNADGTATLRGGSFELSSGLDGAIQTIALDGRWRDSRLTGDLDLDMAGLRLIDPDRRTEMARTLSLAGAMSDVPVAQNFAPGLVAPIRDLLSGSNVSAQTTIELSESARRISLRAPAILTTDDTRAEIRPAVDLPLYDYRVGDGEYGLALSADLSRPLPLTLEPLLIRVRSEDGISVDGVGAASGRLSTVGSWRAQTQAGRPARMGPLSVGFDYAAPQDTPSLLTLTGGVNYDGDVPGGYITGLRASGQLSARTSEARTRLDFAPDRTLRFTQLETPSEWVVENFEGRLRPRSPLYARPANSPAAIATNLADTTFTASRPASEAADAASLDIQVGTATLTGQVGETQQDWTIGFTELALQSDTFPVEGTDLKLPAGELVVGLSEGSDPTFALDAPSSTLRTPAYVVQNMALQASGTAERYELAFEGGRVKVIAPTEDAVPLPILPASGTLLFENGAFSGRAQTALPRATLTPIDVDYRLSGDGVGEADITIRDLRFRPGGLQPQDLAPALRGKIAQVDGAVDAQLFVRFGADTPLSGSGTVFVKDVSLGTAPGPITGLSGRVDLRSLFPVLTAPDQVMEIATFNPGFPLENGSITYALVEDGVDIPQAVFPLGEGQVSFDPFQWTYGAEENRVVLRVSGVEVGEFLKDVGDGRIAISGTLEGSIPVVVRGIDVLVENGRLEVSNGGTIRVKGEDLADRVPNPNAARAFEALENFVYESLFLEIDGPLDGDVKLGVEFTGSNPEVLFGVPFQFDVTVEGELFNIARNLNPNGLQQRLLTTVVEEATEQTP